MFHNIPGFSYVCEYSSFLFYSLSFSARIKGVRAGFFEVNRYEKLNPKLYPMAFLCFIINPTRDLFLDDKFCRKTFSIGHESFTPRHIEPVQLTNVL